MFQFSLLAAEKEEEEEGKRKKERKLKGKDIRKAMEKEKKKTHFPQKFPSQPT